MVEMKVGKEVEGRGEKKGKLRTNKALKGAIIRGGVQQLTKITKYGIKRHRL